MRQQQHTLTFAELREDLLAEIDDAQHTINLMQKVLNNKIKIPTYFTYEGYAQTLLDYRSMQADSQVALAMLQGMQD